MEKQKKNIIGSIIFIVLSLYIFIDSFTIKSFITEKLGPSFVPQVAAVITFILAAYLLISSIISLRKENSKKVKKDEDGETSKENNKTNEQNISLVATLVLFILYAALLKSVGFIICTAVYMFLQMILLRNKKELSKKIVLRFFVISLIVSPALYFIFYYAFQVFLPAGILG